MEGPANEHSDSDSGESWTLLDQDLALNGDSPNVSKNTLKSFNTENSEKDEDTDGISVISDSEPESPSSFLVNSCNSILEDQSVKEKIPVYTKNIELATNLSSKEDNDTKPLIEDSITGDNIKHKIYVHRRNNRLSTVLNIIMLVSVMTAAGVAIGHMWGAKNDCPSQTTPSFNKILSDLYKLQAENADYRNKLKELSLIIEDSLHNECERESELLLNKQQTVKCRQQKIHEIQAHLRSNNGEGRRSKRGVTPYAQKPDEDKTRKSMSTQNISKIKAKEQRFDRKLISNVYNVIDKSQSQEKEEILIPEVKEENTGPERKISYADSLKTNNYLKEDTNDNVYKNSKKKLKHRKKIKDTNNFPQSSTSEDDLVKDGRYSTPKHKLQWKKRDRQKLHKNSKRRNKHEDWDLKEGLLKYYEDLSTKLLNSNNFVQNKINEDVKEHTKVHKKSDNDENKMNPYNDYIKQREIENNIKSDINLNWYDNRAQLRKEARLRQEQELLNVSTSNTGDWYFKRMHKREECRAKENSNSKRIPNKRRNFKTRS